MFSGEYLAIRGQRTNGATVYLEYAGDLGGRDIQDHLTKINNDLNRRADMQRKWRDSTYNSHDLETERAEAYQLLFSASPFDRRLFRPDHNPKHLIANLKAVQYLASRHEIDPSSVEYVSINVHIGEFVPPEDSELEVQMRKAALDRLSPSEQRLLKVVHWKVYDKLADRTGLDDEQDNEAFF